MTHSSRAGTVGGSGGVSIETQPERLAAPSAARSSRNSRLVFTSLPLCRAHVEVVLVHAALAPVALAFQEGEDRAALGLLEVVLDRQRADAVAREIKALQRLELRTLDVHAHIVYEPRSFRLREQLGQRARLQLDHPGALRLPLPASQALLDAADDSCRVEPHALAGDAVDGHGEQGAAAARHVGRKGIDAHPFPTQVLEHLRVGVQLAVAGAHVDEVSLAQPGVDLERDPAVLAAFRAEPDDPDVLQRRADEPRQRGDAGARVDVVPFPPGRAAERGARREDQRRQQPARGPEHDHYPRPTNGILVAMMVMNSTLVSSGRFAMCRTASPTWSTSMRGSGRISRFACGTPSAMREASGVRALPMSIWPTEMSYFLPSSELALVRPVTACLVEV